MWQCNGKTLEVRSTGLSFVAHVTQHRLVSAAVPEKNVNSKLCS